MKKILNYMNKIKKNKTINLIKNCDDSKSIKDSFLIDKYNNIFYNDIYSEH